MNKIYSDIFITALEVISEGESPRNQIMDEQFSLLLRAPRLYEVILARFVAHFSSFSIHVIYGCSGSRRLSVPSVWRARERTGNKEKWKRNIGTLTHFDRCIHCT